MEAFPNSLSIKETRLDAAPKVKPIFVHPRKKRWSRRIENPSLLKDEPAQGSLESEKSSLKIDWLTTVEAAAYLKVSPKSVRNMVSNGTIPAHRLGRRLRFLVGELNSLLLSGKKGK